MDPMGSDHLPNTYNRTCRGRENQSTIYLKRL